MKKLLLCLLTFTLILAASGCTGRSMNHIIAKEPSITGTVTVADEDAILITLPEPSQAQCWVSLNVEHPDSMNEFSVGDEVVVYYDGSIAESDPMQIHHVYAILLKTPAQHTR